MYPQAFDGGPPTYGLAIAGGFLLATIVGARSSRRRGIDVGFWLDLCFWLIPISLIGARLLHVLVNAREFIDSCRAPSAGELAHSPLWRCSRALHIWEGGFAYLGGVIAATAFSWWFCRRRKLPFLRVADLGAPALAVGHVLGRLGCYFAGCCFGRPNPRWGARFPRGSVAFDEWLRRGELSPLATRTPRLHPTQLYEALGELLLFVALSAYGPYQRAHGEVFALYLVGYGALRFALECLRDDPSRGFIWRIGRAKDPRWLSTSQGLGLAAVGLGLALWIKLKRERRARRAPPIASES